VARSSSNSGKVAPNPGVEVDRSTAREPAPLPTTADRILDVALVSFARRGYETTSLDALADELGIRKQSILYWFPSKETILDAVIDRAASDLARALERSLGGAGDGWHRVEAVVRSAFRLGAARPELFGLVREATRLGPPAATRLIGSLDPLVARASAFLQAEMDAGHMRHHEPRLLLLAIYATVVGMITEVDVLRALGEEPEIRSLVRRRQEILRLLHSALMPDSTAT